MENKQIDLVIFDMDGTIFDTERLGIECWEKAFDYLNIEVPKDMLFSKIGLNSRDSKKMFEDKLAKKASYDELKKLKRKFVREYIDEKGTPIKKGLIELLDFIDKKGLKKIIATSRSKEMTHYYIDNSVIKERFENVICGDMIEKGKPCPDIFIQACNAVGCSFENAVILEDSLNGIMAGNNAKIKTIFIPDLITEIDENNNLDFIRVENLLDVIKFLEGDFYK